MNTSPALHKDVSAPAAEPPAALTVREFCHYARLSRTMVYYEIKAGRLRVRKVGKKSLILRTDAENWLKALPVASLAMGAA